MLYMGPKLVIGFFGSLYLYKADNPPISLSIYFSLSNFFRIEDLCLFVSYSFPVFFVVINHGCTNNFFSVSLSSGFHYSN